ncbi:MAG: HRDC domain-containing protein [Sodaliphilus sp.]
MQIKVFTIPLFDSDALIDELNLFLRAHKIVDVRKELVAHNDTQFWSFCITYLDDAKMGKQNVGNQKVDYRSLLAPDSFERFSSMRRVRADLAKEEAVPAYAIFTDAELAELAKLPKLTLSSMQSVEGVGKKKIEKYAKYFIEESADEKGRLSD